MPKQPTARGISRLLGSEFTRYDATLTRVWPGFQVAEDSPGRVRVDYRGAADDPAVMLAKYATVIREAGWPVEMSAWLIVTAKGKADE